MYVYIVNWQSSNICVRCVNFVADVYKKVYIGLANSLLYIVKWIKNFPKRNLWVEENLRSRVSGL